MPDIDKKTGSSDLGAGSQAQIVDLPGTYSLYPKRSDEWVTYKVLLHQDGEVKVDMVILLVDASNLRRNLLFCSQIIDLKIPVAGFEINLDAIPEAKKKARTAFVPSPFQAIERDFVFVVDAKVAAGEIVKAAGKGPFRQLVDLGSGTGRMLTLLGPKAQNAIGLDLSQQMLNIARSHVANSDLEHCELRHGDIFATRLPAEVADLVVVHQVLHYLDDPGAASRKTNVGPGTKARKTSAGDDDALRSPSVEDAPIGFLDDAGRSIEELAQLIE